MIRALSLSAVVTMALSAVGCGNSGSAPRSHSVQSAETISGGGSTTDGGTPTTFTNSCNLSSADLTAYPISQDGTMTACSINIVSTAYDGNNQPTVHDTTVSCTGVDSSFKCVAHFDTSSSQLSVNGSYTHGEQVVPLTSDACWAYIARAGYACGQQNGG